MREVIRLACCRFMVRGFAAFLLFSVACSNDNPFAHRPFQDTDEPIISENAKLIEENDFETHLISISGDGATFVFSEGSNAIEELQTGSILVSEYGHGYLREVTRVSSSDGQITIETTQATITEAVKRGSASFTHSFSPSDTVRSLYIRHGVRLVPTAPSDQVFSFELNNVVLFDVDGDENTTNDQVVANGSFSLESSINFEIEIDDWQLEELEISHAFTEDMDLSVSVDLIDIEGSKEKEIFSTQLHTITFFIGWFPVVITPEISVSVGIDGSIHVSVATGVTQHAEFTAGLRFADDQWQPISELEHEFDFQEPTISADAEAKAYIGPEVTLFFYGVVGPKANITLYGELIADVTADPWAVLYCGIQAGLGVVVEVFSHELVDYSKSDLLDFRIELWQASQPPIGVPTLEEPSNGSTITDQTPYFNWSSVSGATRYQIQVDNSSSFSSPNIDTQTSSSNYTSTISLSAGTYYWRVKAGDGSNWGDWSVSSYFTIGSIGTPTLQEPTNGSTITDQTPYFNWTSVSGATRYQIQVDNSSSFSSPNIDTQTSSSNYTSTISLSAGTYYWRVKAGDGSNWGDWSVSSYFTIGSIGTPTLQEPTNGSTITDQTPYFNWTSVSGATRYQIQVDNSSSFSSPNIDTQTSSSNYTSTISLSAGTYYWRVKAGDGSIWGDWSASSYFTIGSFGTPVLYEPSNGDTITDQTPNFDWSSVSGATVYQIQVDNSSSFSSPNIDDLTGSSSYTASTTLGFDTYYWRVRAGDSSTLGDWSDEWHFTISGMTGVSVSSSPPGASIALDGVSTGYLTPAVLANVSVGYHTISLFKEGYNEYVEDFYYDGSYYSIDADLTIPQPPFPVFVIYSPEDGATYNDNVITVSGLIELEDSQGNQTPFDGSTAILTLNGVDQTLQVSSGSFNTEVGILEGANTLRFRATSENGDTGVSELLTVYGDFDSDDIVITLSWNTPTSDLDLHIWNPLGEHCCWRNMTITEGSLDIDDVEGFGPETFTATNALTGTYTVMVNCYDLDEDSYADAGVSVRLNGGTPQVFGPHHFTVADHEGTNPAAWWEVTVFTMTTGKRSDEVRALTEQEIARIRADMINLPPKRKRQ